MHTHMDIFKGGREEPGGAASSFFHCIVSKTCKKKTFKWHCAIRVLLWVRGEDALLLKLFPIINVSTMTK